MFRFSHVSIQDFLQRIHQHTTSHIDRLSNRGEGWEAVRSHVYVVIAYDTHLLWN